MLRPAVPDPQIAVNASMFIPALTPLLENSQTVSWLNPDAATTVGTSGPGRQFLFRLFTLPSRHSQCRHAIMATRSAKSQHGLISVISRRVAPGLQAFPAKKRGEKRMVAQVIIELNNS